jgi:hypothetical protein
MAIMVAQLAELSTNQSPGALIPQASNHECYFFNSWLRPYSGHSGYFQPLKTASSQVFKGVKTKISLLSAPMDILVACKTT